ncbi:MAG: hypothetical protein WC775_02310 [Patescibacteria group bacterium]|jgi:hypothetical protein
MSADLFDYTPASESEFVPIWQPVTDLPVSKRNNHRSGPIEWEPHPMLSNLHIDVDALEDVADELGLVLPTVIKFRSISHPNKQSYIFSPGTGSEPMSLTLPYADFAVRKLTQQYKTGDYAQAVGLHVDRVLHAALPELTRLNFALVELQDPEIMISEMKIFLRSLLVGIGPLALALIMNAASGKFHPFTILFFSTQSAMATAYAQVAQHMRLLSRSGLKTFNDNDQDKAYGRMLHNLFIQKQLDEPGNHMSANPLNAVVPFIIPVFTPKMLYKCDQARRVKDVFVRGGKL